MRDFKGMKRQRSRNRGGGGGSGGGKPQHNANRAFESNGPDGVKIRGAAQHVFEKYQQLARDALTAGDRVLGESYQQHAEHYFRLLRAVQPQRPASDILGRDSFTSGIDIDFEDESGEGDGGQETSDSEADRGEWRQENRYEGRRDERPQRDQQQPRAYNEQRPRQDQQRDDRQRGDAQRQDQPRQDQARQDQPRDDRQRDERPREERQPREERPRSDRSREDRGERRYERAERVADPLPVVEPHAAPLTAPEAEQPSSPVLRSQDGGTSQAPAFLQARVEPKPETSDDAEPRPRARRRRAPRSFEGAAGEAAEGASPSSADVSEKA
jgi:hypothetical protein